MTRYVHIVTITHLYYIVLEFVKFMLVYVVIKIWQDISCYDSLVLLP